MPILDVTDGDDITSAINSSSAPVVPAGTYRLSGDVNFWGKEVLFEGDVTLRVPGGLSPSNESGSLAFRGDGHVGFTDAGGSLTIDQTADRSAVVVQLGAGARFGDANGHVTFDGPIDLRGQQRNSAHPYAMSVGRTGEYTITNVHWPDGCMDPSNWGFLWTDTNGDVTFRGCYIRGFANNCIYAATMGGRLEVHGCYFEDNTVAAIRTGANRGTLAADTTFHYGTPVATQWFTGGSAQRGIWCQSYDGGAHDVTLRNCDFVRDGPAASAAVVGDAGGSYTIHLDNTRFSHPNAAILGSNLTVAGQVQGGASDPGPESVTGAATGPGPGPGTTEHHHRLVIVGPGQGTTDYEITVQGVLDPGPEAEHRDEITDNGDGTTTADGSVAAGDTDDWEYTGTLTDVQWSGADPGAVTLDGVEQALDELPPTRPTDAHVVTIQGRGGTTSYAITADSVEKHDADEVDFQVSRDGVQVAFGTVSERWADAWTVTGEMDFEYRGVKPRVRIDDEERDADDI